MSKSKPYVPPPRHPETITPNLMGRWFNFIRLRGDCWIWRGACAAHNGEARISADGRMIAARSVSWVIFYGKRTKRFLCMSCHNPACVNPLHLIESNYAAAGRTHYSKMEPYTPLELPAWLRRSALKGGD